MHQISMEQGAHWSHQKLYEYFSTDPDQGLSSLQAQELYNIFGPNELESHAPRSLFSLILGQFKSPLIWLLCIATIIAFAMGEFIDGGIVVFVLVFNTILGTYQEAKAQRTFLSLSKLTTTEVIVLRDGKQTLLPNEELVPGDIVFLHEGDKIPADIRLLTSKNIRVNESILTGESLSVQKDSQDASDENPYENASLVWAGTHIEKGSAQGIILATGRATRMGQLAQEVAQKDREVPLQKRVKRLANILVVIGFVSLILLFVLGLLLGRDLHELIRIAIALLVSVVPEGLPVVMTLILSAGVYRMSKEHVLVKRLQAIETLGHAQIVATDKTGTITRNELMVSDLWIGHESYQVSGVGYDPHGKISSQDQETSDALSPAITRLVALVERSANAKLIYDGDRTKIIGDPTEAAMRVLGMKIGLEQDSLRNQTPFVDEIEFDFRKKYYATHFDIGNGSYEMVVTGAGEVLLSHAVSYIDTTGKEISLTDVDRKEILHNIAQYSDQGLRVIGVAYRALQTDQIQHDDVKNLVFVGLMAMKDAVRESVPAALERTRNAGMQVVMITGDHVSTATSLARDAGIFRPGDVVLSGPEIQDMSIEELSTRLDQATVFARITPRDKMKIIEAYQFLGKTIAMTGDGVNDVPSLAAADLGIAMGITGTEAAKEAADIILLEDDFGDIPLAVDEGRNIALAMKRVVLYLLATNIAELLIIMIAVIVGFPIPLTPAQIMWMNVVSDSFIVIALGLQVASPKILHAIDYERISKKFIDRSDMGRMIVRIVIMTVGPLGVFFLVQYVMGNYAAATTSALFTLILVQIFNAWYMTKQARGVMEDNRLFIMSIVALGLLAILFIIPGLDDIFGVALPVGWILPVIVAVAGVVMLEGFKKER